MTDLTTIIMPRDITQINETSFSNRYVGCVVLSHDHKVLLQQRGSNWTRYPSYLAEFGGQIEKGESPMQALVRELKEELGARVEPVDVIHLGAISEMITNHTELIYVYFWHDKRATITGCYEGEAKYFERLEDVLCHPKIMDSLRWLLSECRLKKLI